ncbi:unnamed protein product [Parnassius apollo]|uniref:(apollo) hypothetical protein n=1 Tax=Parnassius apollo TaxID=110799 RepID=A0A8S3WPT6_PARAO|nr:unnamed protein product [Parnassius apollo]
MNFSVLQWLREAETEPSEAWRSAGASSGLAVVDPLGTYVALVTAVSQSGASGTSSAGAEAAGAGAAGGAAGWRRDAPRARLDVAPALIVQQQVCGTRYVVGAGSWSALVQCTAQWAGGAAPASGVRAPRLPALRGAAPVNLVREQADALLSHADARAGPDGLAARF